MTREKGKKEEEVENKTKNLWVENTDLSETGTGKRWQHILHCLLSR